MIRIMALIAASTATFALAPYAHPQLATAAMAEGDVLTRAVPRGAILRTQDFEKRRMPAPQLRFALGAEQAAGKEARRTLPAGITLRASDIMEPLVVHRGDRVVVSLRSGSLTITAPGKALADASAGEPVRVLNLATNRSLDAQAKAAGEVEVMAP